MKIGDLARAAGVDMETIRYYERAGLLPEPERLPNSYRVYGRAHLERLTFVRRCRSLDMSLPEIRMLLEAIERPDANCSPVNALLDEHIRHVAARIAELRQLKSELDAIRAHCKGDVPTRSCGILNSLARPSRDPVPRRPHVPGTHGGRS
jgi:Cd(II)/Pb(II)-responsive transcriptional regulator